MGRKRLQKELPSDTKLLDEGSFCRMMTAKSYLVSQPWGWSSLAGEVEEGRDEQVGNVFVLKPPLDKVLSLVHSETRTRWLLPGGKNSTFQQAGDANKVRKLLIKLRPAEECETQGGDL